MLEIKLTDNEVIKTFEIHKFTAWEQFLYTNKILGLLAQTETINSDIIRGIYCYNLGLDIPNQEETVLALYKGFGVLSFDLLSNLLSVLTEERQVEIIKPLINLVVYKNGVLDIKLDLIDGSDKNINFYINDYITIFKLVHEVLIYNYKYLYNFFFSQTK